MKRIALALGIGAVATTLAIDDAIDRSYASAIRYFARHPRLRNNFVGRAVEDSLISAYLSRNMPRERIGYDETYIR